MMRNYASKIVTWVGLMGIALMLTACTGTPAHEDPCAGGCAVPGVGVPQDPYAEYVPLCADVDDHQGPCVGRMAGAWYYVAQDAVMPHGVRLAPCRVESGGPVPCVWVPSVMGNQQGDSGAYVYRVAN